MIKIIITSDGLDITYNICCDKYNDFMTFQPNNGNGFLYFNVSKITNYSTCNVICSVNDNEEYRYGYTSFISKVTDICPASETSYKNIISLKMIYPDERSKPGLILKLKIKEVDENGKDVVSRNCDRFDSVTSKTDGNFFKYENIRFNCTSTSSNEEGEYGSEEDLENAELVQYMCGEELADLIIDGWKW